MNVPGGNTVVSGDNPASTRRARAALERYLSRLMWINDVPDAGDHPWYPAGDPGGGERGAEKK